MAGFDLLAVGGQSVLTNVLSVQLSRLLFLKSKLNYYIQRSEKKLKRGRSQIRLTSICLLKQEEHLEERLLFYEKKYIYIVLHRVTVN